MDGWGRGMVVDNEVRVRKRYLPAIYIYIFT